MHRIIGASLRKASEAVADSDPRISGKVYAYFRAGSIGVMLGHDTHEGALMQNGLQKVIDDQ